MHHHPEPSTPALGGSLGREKSPTKLPEPSMKAHYSHPHFPEAFKARLASANLLSIRSLVPAEELNDSPFFLPGRDLGLPRADAIGGGL